MEPTTIEKRRLRVLLSAYACEPERGSEPGVGWNWVKQLSKSHDVWVLTRSNNRGAIERALAVQDMEGAHFAYFDLPRWVRFWKKGSRGIRLYYYLWQIGAYFRARALHAEIRFDIVHHVTFVKYWMPALLSLLPAPFVWGPVGGAESMPASFRRSLSFRGRVYEALRDLARTLGDHDPLVRLTANRAVLGLATTDDSRARMLALGCRTVRIFSEAGLADQELEALDSEPRRNGASFRFVSSGNLLHLKGFELSLRAFARLVQEDGFNGEYWFLGDGPERRRLETLASELGVRDKVVFWGRLRRADALEKLKQCEVLVHPSLHDSGGWVCLEAMAAGRPVICLDLGGPGVQVTAQTGIKVMPVTPSQTVADLADALKRLSGDEQLRLRLAQAGKARVRREFGWARKAEVISDAYFKALSASGERS